MKKMLVLSLLLTSCVSGNDGDFVAVGTLGEPTYLGEVNAEDISTFYYEGVRCFALTNGWDHSTSLSCVKIARDQ